MNVTLTVKSWLGMDSSPESLMLAYRDDGDSKVLAHLYECCGQDLYHFLISHSDHTLAKDIAQKTWLTVIEKRHLYQPHGSFKTWLFTIGRRLLVDEFRKTGRLSAWEDQPELADESDAPNLKTGMRFDEKIVDDAFKQAFARLPLPQREAFSLQQEGFNLKEISDITGSETEAVKSRIRYAKKALKSALEQYYGE